MKMMLVDSFLSCSCNSQCGIERSLMCSWNGQFEHYMHMSLINGQSMSLNSWKQVNKPP